MKRAIAIILLLSVALLLTSCSFLKRQWDAQLSLDENIHGAVEYPKDNTNTPHILYKGTKYFYAGDLWVTNIGNVDEDVMLSWNGNRWFGYIFAYYSYSDDYPLYIYEAHGGSVYYREDYDHLSDTFAIGGTEDEVVLSSIYSSEEQDKYLFDFAMREVKFTSKTDSRIKIIVYLLFDDDRNMLISFGSPHKVYRPTELFVEILKKNGII